MNKTRRALSSAPSAVRMILIILFLICVHSLIGITHSYTDIFFLRNNMHTYRKIIGRIRDKGLVHHIYHIITMRLVPGCYTDIPISSVMIAFNRHDTCLGLIS